MIKNRNGLSFKLLDSKLLKLKKPNEVPTPHYFSMYYNSCQVEQQSNKLVDSSDIPLFWTAYDAITQSQDSTEQVRSLNDFFVLFNLFKQKGYFR